MSISYRAFLCLLCLFASRSASAADAPATRPFLAGAATSDITPPLGASINGGFQDRRAVRIHDELHARCLVLDDGTTRVAFAVCDSCMIPRPVMDEAKALIAKRSGLAADHVLISATHTHEAPAAAGVFQSEPDPEYTRFLARRIADGVQRAIDNLAPARIGWGAGAVPQHVFNRRWQMRPGSIPADPFGGKSDRVQMNPPVGSPDLVEPAGPTDPQVSVLSVRSADGRPIAVLANYSLHYVGGEAPGAISADYYGMFAPRLAHLLGADGPEADPPFVAIMSNGTSGNVNNIDFTGKRKALPPYGQMRVVADDVAREVARVCAGIEYRDTAPLAVRQAPLELAVRKPTAEEVSRARELLAHFDRPVGLTAPEVYARETIHLADYPDHVELLLQAIRIGDLAIAAIPCEVFAEIGLDLKARSPFHPTFTIELANGYNGYLPTPEQHQLGGYETWRARSSYLEVDASTKITRTLMGLLEELGK